MNFASIGIKSKEKTSCFMMFLTITDLRGIVNRVFTFPQLGSVQTLYSALYIAATERTFWCTCVQYGIGNKSMVDFSCV